MTGSVIDWQVSYDFSLKHNVMPPIQSPEILLVNISFPIGTCLTYLGSTFVTL